MKFLQKLAVGTAVVGLVTGAWVGNVVYTKHRFGVALEKLAEFANSSDFVKNLGFKLVLEGSKNESIAHADYVLAIYPRDSLPQQSQKTNPVLVLNIPSQFGLSSVDSQVFIQSASSSQQVLAFSENVNQILNNLAIEYNYLTDNFYVMLELNPTNFSMYDQNITWKDGKFKLTVKDLSEDEFDDAQLRFKLRDYGIKDLLDQKSFNLGFIKFKAATDGISWDLDKVAWKSPQWLLSCDSISQDLDWESDQLRFKVANTFKIDDLELSDTSKTSYKFDYIKFKFSFSDLLIPQVSFQQSLQELREKGWTTWLRNSLLADYQHPDSALIGPLSKADFNLDFELNEAQVELKFNFWMACDYRAFSERWSLDELKHCLRFEGNAEVDSDLFKIANLEQYRALFSPYVKDLKDSTYDLHILYEGTKVMINDQEFK